MNHVWIAIIYTNIPISFYTFRKQSLGVYTCKNHLVRLSVRAIVSGPYLFMENHWKFLLHTNIAYDPKVCLDFEPWSFWQAQCHWKEEKKIYIVSAFYSSYEDTLDVPTSHKYCLWPEGVSWTLTKFRCANLRSL